MADFEGKIKLKITVAEKNKNEEDSKEVTLDITPDKYFRNRGTIDPLTSNVAIDFCGLSAVNTLFADVNTQAQMRVQEATGSAVVGAASGAPLLIGRADQQLVTGLQITNMTLSTTLNYDVWGLKE